MVAIDGTRIHAEVRLENTGDRACFNHGYGNESDIRRSTVDAIVDTRAVALTLPEGVVERLGLRELGMVLVCTHDERRVQRPRAGPVTVQIGNRSTIMDCVVGPSLSEPLIGRVVLAMLDLSADEASRTLRPRHPGDYPMINLKVAARAGGTRSAEGQR